MPRFMPVVCRNRTEATVPETDRHCPEQNMSGYYPTWTRSICAMKRESEYHGNRASKSYPENRTLLFVPGRTRGRRDEFVVALKAAPLRSRGST